jgi:Alpha amylase, catalytic domain/FlgD Ig-like domain
MKSIVVAFLLFALLAGALPAQVVTWAPAHPTIDDSVVITFDASLGNAALVGVTPVFAHTGVINKYSTDIGDWQHRVSEWGSGYDSTIVMTSLGNNRHRIGFVPRSFYGLSLTEEVRAIALVFRNQASTLAGKNGDGTDIYIPIFPDSNFTAIFAKPMERPQILALNDVLSVDVQANAPALITIFKDGIPIAQSSGLVSQFSTAIAAGSYGRYDLSFTADNGLVTVRDTVGYIVQPPITVANVPSGYRDGINYVDATTVGLVLLAPQKTFGYVIGDFNDWQMDPAYLMKRTPDGQRYWLEINGLTPGQEYRFQYFVDHAVKIGDPYAEKVLDQWNDNGVNNFVYPNLIRYPTGLTSELVTILQTNKPEYNWQINNYQRPDNRDLVIYELLVRDFVLRHDYGTLIDTLDYLEKLGINCIELMPVNEFDGNQSWGYGPAYYFAPDKYYGTENRLKEFIDACHARGIAVVLDAVFNHAFGQCPLVRLYQDRGTGLVATNNPWLNVASPHPLGLGYDFNHASAYTQTFFDSVLSYWAQEYRVDGFRLDLSKGFTNRSTSNIGDWSIYDQDRINYLTRMASHFWANNYNKYFIIEHFANNDEETVLANHGIMLWGKASEPYYQAAMGFEQASDFSGLMSYQAKGWSYHNLVGFVESHDEERTMYKNYTFGNGVNPAHDCRDTIVALKRMAAIAAFWATIPGPKMMWQFQELGYDVSIDVPCRTCPKPIRWSYLQNGPRQLLYKKYAAIVNLKTKHPDAFRSSSYDISAWGKQKQIHVNSTAMNVTVIGNFDVYNQDTYTGFQHTGRWYNYMSGDSLEVTDMAMTINLTPGDFRIFTDVRLPKPDLSITLPPVGIIDADQQNALAVQVSPNPFMGETSLSFTLPARGNLRFMVHDLMGNVVYTIYYPMVAAGEHTLQWDGSTSAHGVAAAGTYLYTVTSGELVARGKLVRLH